MNAALSRRALLGGALSAVASVALADAPLSSLRPVLRDNSQATPDADLGRVRPQARRSLDDIIAQAELGGAVAVSVVDMSTGRVLEARVTDTPLPPASVTKAVTALYALDILGTHHRFTTRLISTGTVSDGVLDGNLILAGGGDPVLTTDHLAELAEALKQAGVSQVTGAFQVYGSTLPYEDEIDDSQMDHLGYNPAISGLNLNFNRVHFEWAKTGSSYRVSMDARSDHYRPQVSMAQMRVAERRHPIFDYEDSGDVDHWSVARSALGNNGSRWLPVRKPALYAGDVFRTLARSQGIVLQSAQRITALPVGRELARHDSIPLTQILRDMLKYSTNLTAEVVGLAASIRQNHSLPADLQSSAWRMTQWINRTFGVQTQFMDHSGLSDRTRVTAADLIAILTQPGTHARLQPILKQIQLRDSEGTLIDHAATVTAKTGTLNFVSTLAGYIRTPDGNDLAFAILSGDVPRREIGKRSPDEQPQGASGYNTRAKRLQQRLLQRWSTGFTA